MQVRHVWFAIDYWQACSEHIDYLGEYNLPIYGDCIWPTLSWARVALRILQLYRRMYRFVSRAHSHSNTRVHLWYIQMHHNNRHIRMISNCFLRNTCTQLLVFHHYRTNSNAFYWIYENTQSCLYQCSLLSILSNVLIYITTQFDNSAGTQTNVFINCYLI